MAKIKSVQDIRAQLDEILERARNDDAFGQKLNSDPESTLRKEGLYPQAIGEVSDEIRQFAQGKRNRSDYEASPAKACDFTTCWISWCDKWTTFHTSG